MTLFLFFPFSSFDLKVTCSLHVFHKWYRGKNSIKKTSIIRDVGRGDDNGTTGPSDNPSTAAEGRDSRHDGGGGVVASYEDDGRDVGRSDDAATTQVAKKNPVATREGGGGSDGGGGEATRPQDDGDAAEEGGGGRDSGRGVGDHLRDDGRDVGRDGEDGETRDHDDDETDAAAEGNSGRAGGQRGGREQGRARVRPDPGGLTSPGGIRRLGSWEPGHTPGRGDFGGRAMADGVA